MHNAITKPRATSFEQSNLLRCIDRERDQNSNSNLFCLSKSLSILFTITVNIWLCTVARSCWRLWVKSFHFTKVIHNERSDFIEVKLFSPLLRRSVCRALLLALFDSLYSRKVMILVSITFQCSERMRMIRPKMTELIVNSSPRLVHFQVSSCLDGMVWGQFI